MSLNKKSSSGSSMSDFEYAKARIVKENLQRQREAYLYNVAVMKKSLNLPLTIEEQQILSKYKRRERVNVRE